MTTKTVDEPTMLDTLKLSFAALLLLAAVIAFYWYAEYSLLYRVLALLAVVSIAAAVALMTARGRELLGFLAESRTEVRRMVWPTRAETVQTTLIVFVMVIIVGVFLWLLDLLLGWLTGFVI